MQVEVTPRERRVPEHEGDSSFKKEAARESVPDRGLRKLKAKLRNLSARAARGEHQRIVSKQVVPAPALPKPQLLRRQLCFHPRYRH